MSHLARPCQPIVLIVRDSVSQCSPGWPTTPYLDQVCLELVILLLQPPEYYDSSHEPPHLARDSLEINMYS